MVRWTANYKKDETEIDKILDKMSKNGIHSLSNKEWKILDKYKRRK